MNFKSSVIKLTLSLLMVFSLAGCDAFVKKTPESLPTLVLDSNPTSTQAATRAVSGGVAASGIVAPAEEARLAPALGGMVETVNVEVGSQVQAGQVLVKLAGSEKLAAAVETANLELLSAQQAYKDLDDNLAADQNQALQALNDARQAVKDSQSRVANLGGTADAADIDIARSQLIFAEHALKDAQDKYKRFDNLPEDNLARARYRVVLAGAQKDYDAALRKYNSLVGTSTNFDRQQAQTDLEIAQKQLELAQKDYDQLQLGPDPDLVAAAEARIKNAQAQLTASQAALNDLELKAPFSGTVATLNIHAGEWVVPGQNILVLVDLEHLRIETTDLSERDVPKVKVGQSVTVFIKALNQDVTGTVKEIAPLADTLGGDVVYKTTIDLETPPDDLRAGMSVEVQFGSE